MQVPGRRRGRKRRRSNAVVSATTLAGVSSTALRALDDRGHPAVPRFIVKSGRKCVIASRYALSPLHAEDMSTARSSRSASSPSHRRRLFRRTSSKRHRNGAGARCRGRATCCIAGISPRARRKRDVVLSNGAFSLSPSPMHAAWQRRLRRRSNQAAVVGVGGATFPKVHLPQFANTGC